MSTERAIIAWMNSGQTGISSETMAYTHLGMPNSRHQTGNHPYDPDDFNRCLMLLEHVPEIRESFPEIATLSKSWGAIIQHWDELEKTFVSEVGRNWCNGSRAPKTYDFMKRILKVTP